MELDIFTIDAFADRQFKGNPAAVIPIKEWLEPNLMQKIAAENNLSETAFIKALKPNQYQIRWFSPSTEIDFCGHATLASSYVIFNLLDYKGEIEFLTEKVGSLYVSELKDGRIEMSFPNQSPKDIEKIPAELLNGLSFKPIEVLRNRQAYFAVMESEYQVRNIECNAQKLISLAPFDIVVTAKSDNYDFVSRYFWPANGGNEDPVTGSIHSGLAPYWAKQLSKTELVAYQASKRGGVLHCKVSEEKVFVSGFGILYLKGKIFI